VTFPGFPGEWPPCHSRDGFQQQIPPPPTAPALADFPRAYDRVRRKAQIIIMMCLWHVVHTVAGVDPAHAGDLRRLLVPAVGRGYRLGVRTVLHTTTTGHCCHQGPHGQGAAVQGNVYDQSLLLL